MTTCTFWGGDLFEQDVWQRLVSQLEQLLARDDEFTFYFSLDTPFERLAYSALCEVKPRYPHKHISIEWVDHRPRAVRDTIRTRYHYLAHQPFNQRITLSMPPAMSRSTRSRRVLKWRLENTSHLFFYFYDLLFLADMRLLHMVKKRVEKGELELIPLTDPATERRLEQHLNSLSAEKRMLLRSVLQGVSFEKLSQMFHLHPEAVRRQHIEAQHTLLDTVERFPFEL